MERRSKKEKSPQHLRNSLFVIPAPPNLSCMHVTKNIKTAVQSLHSKTQYSAEICENKGRKSQDLIDKEEVTQGVRFNSRKR